MSSYSSVVSTNDVAWEEGRAAFRAAGTRRVAVLAAEQTGGRGRAGRTWSSPAGAGLYLSAYLRLDWPPGLASHLTLAAGLAARAGCAHAAGLAPDLKWPNDLIAPDGSGRKLGGILTETRSEGARVPEAVVGVGINLRAPEAGYGADAQARPVALDAWIDPAALPSALALSVAILEALDRELDALVADGPADVVARARGAMPVWGRRVHGERDAQPVEGVAKDLAQDGGLVVRLDSGTEVVMYAGDVRVAWDER